LAQVAIELAEAEELARLAHQRLPPERQRRQSPLPALGLLISTSLS
jgi:hypothetical protein